MQRILFVLFLLCYFQNVLGVSEPRPRNLTAILDDNKNTTASSSTTITGAAVSAEASAEIPDFAVQEKALAKVAAADTPRRRAHGNSSTTVQRPRYRLYYFDFRGRAEPIRMLLHYAGVPFEDFRIPSSKWTTHYKDNTPYGHVPVLVDLHGKEGASTLAESYAILRFLARKHGMSGAALAASPSSKATTRADLVEEAVEDSGDNNNEDEDDESEVDSDRSTTTSSSAAGGDDDEASGTETADTFWAEAKVDEFADFHRDVATEFHPLLINSDKKRTPDQIVRATALADKYFRLYLRQLDIGQASPNRNSTSITAQRDAEDDDVRQDGFLFAPNGGSSPVTWADLLVADFFDELHTTYPRVFDVWPRLDAFRRRVRGLPQLRAYIAQRNKICSRTGKSTRRRTRPTKPPRRLPPTNADTPTTAASPSATISSPALRLPLSAKRRWAAAASPPGDSAADVGARRRDAEYPTVCPAIASTMASVTTTRLPPISSAKHGTAQIFVQCPAAGTDHVTPICRRRKIGAPEAMRCRLAATIYCSRALAAILFVIFLLAAPFSPFSLNDFRRSGGDGGSTISATTTRERWHSSQHQRRLPMAAEAALLQPRHSAANRRYTRFHHRHNRYYYKPRYYRVTLSIRNHNVTEARFFRLVGVDNTVDFHVAPGKIFTNTYEVNRKGYWTLYVEFPGDRYAKSPRKIISRDSHSHWIMEVYYYPESVGFSEWHKMHRPLEREN